MDDTVQLFEKAFQRIDITTESILTHQAVLDNLSNRASLSSISLEGLNLPISPSLSLEANRQKVKSVIQRLVDTLIQAYEYVYRLVKEYISGYRARFDRLTLQFGEVEQAIKTLAKSQGLKNSSYGYLDNLPIGNALFTDNEVSYQEVSDVLPLIGQLIKLTPEILKQRTSTNQRVINNIGALVTLNDLAKVASPQVSIPQARLNAPDDIKRRLNIPEGSEVKVSRPLVSNVTLAQVLFTSSNQGSVSLIPWDQGIHGLHYIPTRTLDRSDRLLFRVPVLTGNQIQSISLVARAQLNEFRRHIDTASTASDRLRSINRDIKRIDLSSLPVDVRNATFNYLKNSVETDMKFITKTMDLGFNTCFYVMHWIKNSIKYYKEGRD